VLCQLQPLHDATECWWIAPWQPAFAPIVMLREIDEDSGRSPQNGLAIQQGWDLSARIESAVGFIHLVASARSERHVYLGVRYIEQRHEKARLVGIAGRASAVELDHLAFSRGRTQAVRSKLTLNSEVSRSAAGDRRLRLRPNAACSESTQAPFC